MLDAAGYPDMQIMASNSLDEYLVRDLLNQGAQIDSFGIGERLITSKSEPVFGGVYKLVAVEDENGEIIPKIKVSENVEKITTPHFKQVYRFYDKLTGKALGDVLTLRDEVINEEQPYMLFHPIHTWKKKIVTDYVVKPCRCSSLTRASASTPARPSRRCGSSAMTRSRRCGSRSAGLKTRRPTMWTTRPNSGASRTPCSRPSSNEKVSGCAAVLAAHFFCPMRQKRPGLEWSDQIQQ